MQNREAAEVHHILILMVSLVIHPRKPGARVLVATSGATRVSSERDSQKCDEVNAKWGIGSAAEPASSYGVPKEMRKVLGERGGAGMRGAMGAG